MGDLNGKCGDGVEMMIVKNIPSFVFPSLVSFFFFVGKYVGHTSKYS